VDHRQPALETLAVTNSTSFLTDYAGARVLVTGHTGFKGTWLTTWLVHLGARVSGLALEPELGPASLFAKTGLNQRMDSRIGDIRSPEVVAAAVAEIRPDIVFHLAAQPLVRRSYRNPVETYETNVMGTVNVLEACRNVDSVKAAVVVTSDKAYENPETGVPLTEDRPLGGRDPYSSSKGAAELVTAAYRSSFFSREGSALVASARAGNVIGAGDESEDRLFPDIVRAIRGDFPIVVRNPSATRPWQHVLEPLRGYLMVGARLLEGDGGTAAPWNFGPGIDDAIDVASLAERVVATWGRGEVSFEPEVDSPHEATLLSLDISKAREQLGFEPILGVDAAISMAVAGCRELDETERSASDILIGQITAYEALLA
jgi:CDP-glucose 4,6-dehydratase